MSDEPIAVIPLSVFRSLADGFQPRGLFAEKAAWLREAYRCFSDPPAGAHHAPSGRREYRDGRRDDRGPRDDRGHRDGHRDDRGFGGGRHRYGDGPRDRDRDRGPPAGLRRPIGLGAAPAEKPRIGNRELSLENLARKEFLGVLNKLSAANHATLIGNFAKLVRPDFADLYVQLFWEGFLRSADYQPVQMRLLPVFNEHFPVQPRVAALLDAYRAQRLWMPADGVLPPAASGTAAVPGAPGAPGAPGDAAAEYDEFCDYVKWRKRTVNTIHAWRTLAEGGWVPRDALHELLGAVLGDFQASLADLPASAKLAETLAEQMFVYVKSIGAPDRHAPATLDALRALPAATFPPALRFKIYDVRDFLGLK